MADLDNVVAGRFPTSESLAVARNLREFLPKVEGLDEDRWLIRLGLWLDETSGLREAAAALQDACKVVNRELLPRRGREDAPAVTIALDPRGEVALYVTRRLSVGEGAKALRTVEAAISAWTEGEALSPSPAGGHSARPVSTPSPAVGGGNQNEVPNA